MRIVQLANLVTPTSGGIRTVLGALGRGYSAAGHDRVEVVPGPGHDEVALPDGGVRRVLPGVPLPGGAGYRLLLDRPAVRAALAALHPDAIEVHDRFTLLWVLRWARGRDLPATLVVHERLVGTLDAWLPCGPFGRTVAAPLARAADAALLAGLDHLVVPSRYAAAAFGDDPRVQVVPLGVDADVFGPAAVATSGPPLRLVSVGRLSREKRPGLAIATVGVLHRRGVPVHLDVVGDGPLRAALTRAATGLPVTFHGHLDRAGVAAATAAADAALATCPIETFGLAALEALATGTPVVVPDRGALPELLTGADPAAGAIVRPTPSAFADAVLGSIAHTRAHRRDAAVAVARARPWTHAVDALLTRHAGRHLAVAP
ncbi:glycosyltransferase family 1 protein [Nitriliruptoraceae bacterium ZYF776]|nr:glycosyltransferase family 1 protein [Profundirhabdus halotolerans]